jgi:hypothetical protein
MRLQQLKQGVVGIPQTDASIPLRAHRLSEEPPADALHARDGGVEIGNVDADRGIADVGAAPVRGARTHPRACELDHLDLDERLIADETPDVERSLGKVRHSGERCAIALAPLAGGEKTNSAPIPPMRS